MFKGFNYKLPEYEVITPHTHDSFTLRTLTVQEEERLKGSMMTASKITDHLNKCIYECIVSKPEHITDFNSFLKNITVKDRDCLLYGLYHITYDEIRDYSIRCSRCEKKYDVTIKASDTFNYNPFPENDILIRKLTIPLKLATGVSVIVRQPTLEDEQKAIKSLASPEFTLETVFETLIITKFIQENSESSEIIEYDSRDDIIYAYRSLPSKDKRIIFEEYEKNFGQYGIELKMKGTCVHCSNEEIINIDLVENFFRMVHSI